MKDPQVCSPNAEVEGSNFGPEGSAEDFTRHGFPSEPSLEGHTPALEEAKGGELTSELQARTQAQASASMIRRARGSIVAVHGNVSKLGNNPGRCEHCFLACTNVWRSVCVASKGVLSEW